MEKRVKRPKGINWGWDVRPDGTMLDPQEVVKIARDGQEAIALIEAMGDVLKRPICIRCGRRMNLKGDRWECPNGDYTISSSLIRRK